jgi:DNA-directed RNA polymerase subunit RPC12/RpoP
MSLWVACSTCREAFEADRHPGLVRCGPCADRAAYRLAPAAPPRRRGGGVSFAVVVCPQCRAPWAVDVRHATAACPSCRKQVELAHRTKLWEGPDAREAQRQAAGHRTQMARKAVSPTVSIYQPTARTARHDSSTQEAAASARGIANKSARAELVAATLSRHGGVPHADLVQALHQAGLDPGRAEAEITRMLAMDILMEPKAGHYRVL